jgi:hypothetical protein
MNPAEYDDLAAEMTIVGGEIFYDAGKNPVTTVLMPPDQSNYPKTFMLLQNYPNPFNAVTNIRYQLPNSCRVTIKIYNMEGQEAAILVQKDQDAGYYTVRWDAKHFNSGLYIYCLEADGQNGGSFQKSMKLLLLK